MHIRHLCALFAVVMLSSCATSTLRPTLDGDFKSLAEMAAQASAQENGPKEPVVQDVIAAEFCFHPANIGVLHKGSALDGDENWNRDVRSFTSDALNILLESDEKNCAPSSLNTQSLGALSGTRKRPPLFTQVFFEETLTERPILELGKNVRIEINSTFPDGRNVQTAVEKNIANSAEVLTEKGFAFSSPIVDVLAFVGTMAFITSSGLSILSPLSCGCLVSLAFTGVAFNAVHQAVAYWVAGQEEMRLSTFFHEALVQHAKDLRALPARANIEQPRENRKSINDDGGGSEMPTKSFDPADFPTPPLMEDAPPSMGDETAPVHSQQEAGALENTVPLVDDTKNEDEDEDVVF